MNKKCNLVSNNNFDFNNDWTVTEKDILLDLQILIDGIFRAKLSTENNRVNLSFDNGQNFVISVNTRK